MTQTQTIKVRKSKLDAHFDGLLAEVERWAANNQHSDPVAAEVHAILSKQDERNDSEHSDNREA